MGIALLHYREGDGVQWVIPGGLLRLWVERVSSPAGSARVGTNEVVAFSRSTTSNDKGVAGIRTGQRYADCAK